jgi:choline dehydrogenase-like flavoprotein
VIVDGRQAVGGLPGNFDVCIVGAGPAGLTIASRLATRGYRVAVIEGGGVEPTIRGQRMLIDRPSGTPYWPLENVRFRMLGGSGSRWGGICRPLDPIDLAERPWIQNSGWPIGWDAVVDYYRQAAESLDLVDADFTRPASSKTAWAPDLPPGDDLEVAYYRLSPKIDFGREYFDLMRRSPGITLMINTNVIGLTLRPDQTAIASVDTRTFAGAHRTVTATTFVLAAGGIENARLLLASPGRDGAALGNEHDVVGRYFSEHIHAPIATFVPADRAWSSYDLTTWPRLSNAIVPTAAVQQAAQLLNASLAIGPTWYAGEPPFVRRNYRLKLYYERLQRAQAAGNSRSVRLAQRALDAVRAPVRALTTRDSARRLITYRGEQPPRRDNRVVLSGKTDEFGRPLAHLQWTVGEQETANAEALLELFRRTVDTHGWGELSAARPDWRERIIGGPHHMGTTRMSDDPRTGVVDRDCRVHSVANLYVAGSSVFPTGGHANPTLTLVALSLRLADHLAGQRR